MNTSENKIYTKKNGSAYATEGSAKAAASKKKKAEGIKAVTLIIKYKEGYAFELQELTESINILRGSIMNTEDVKNIALKSENAMLETELSKMKKELIAERDCSDRLRRKLEDAREMLSIADHNSEELFNTRYALKVVQDEKAELEKQLEESGYWDNITDNGDGQKSDLSQQTVLDDQVNEAKQLFDIANKRKKIMKESFNTNKEISLENLRTVFGEEMPEYDDEYFQEWALRAIKGLEEGHKNESMKTVMVLKAFHAMIGDKFGIADRYLEEAIKIKVLERTEISGITYPSELPNRKIADDLRLLSVQDVPTIKNPEVKEIMLDQAKAYLRVLEVSLHQDIMGAGTQVQYLEALVIKQKLKIASM